MIKLTELLNEIVDIYSPDELNSKGIYYNIDRETNNRFRVEFNYNDQFYVLTCLRILHPTRVSVNFGTTNESFKQLDMNNLINSKYSSRILAAIFGLLRYWLDKYNIQEFEYTADGQTRNKLYQYYLNKHFTDYTHSEENIEGDTVHVMTKNT